MDLTFCNARVLGADGLLARDLGIAKGQIAEPGAGRCIDLGGYYILPGMVDLHGDGFERHLAPRRGAMKDLVQGLLSADAELAANGITTATLAQFYSWEGGMRGPDFARRFLADLGRARPDMHTDIKVQLRFETHMLAEYAEVDRLLGAYDIPYLVFNDHLPHDALEKGKRPPRLTGQALKGGRSPEAHLAMMQEMHAARADVPAALRDLAAKAHARGVLIGSHDDATAQTRDDWHAMGVRIAEFPETRAAAERARALGDAIILGAPNVVRGGSHSGNVSAFDLIEAGLCDALASDYHYPAMRQSVLRMMEAGFDLATAWGLVSSGPARVMGWADRGEIIAGARADLVIARAKDLRIEAVMTGGALAMLSGEAAARFIG